MNNIQLLILYIYISYRFEKDERQDIVQRLWKDITQRRQQLSDIEQSLPKPNGSYLKIILGNVNVSILNKEDKCAYFNFFFFIITVLTTMGGIV